MTKTKNPKVATQVVIASLQKKAAPLIKRLAEFKIDTQADYDKAAVTLRQIKEFAKEAEDRQRLILIPLQQATKATKELFSPFFAQVTQLQEAVKARMVDFLNHQEREKVKLEKAMDSGEIKRVSTFMRKTAALEVDSDAATVRNIKVLVMLDESKTPRAYLVPDQAAIKAALVAGKKVAGWKLDTQKNIAI